MTAKTPPHSPPQPRPIGDAITRRLQTLPALVKQKSTMPGIPVCSSLLSNVLPTCASDPGCSANQGIRGPWRCQHQRRHRGHDNAITGRPWQRCRCRSLAPGPPDSSRGLGTGGLRAATDALMHRTLTCTHIHPPCPLPPTTSSVSAQRPHPPPQPPDRSKAVQSPPKPISAPLIRFAAPSQHSALPVLLIPRQRRACADIAPSPHSPP